jgi:hypothetical protein
MIEKEKRINQEVRGTGEEGAAAVQYHRQD